MLRTSITVCLATGLALLGIGLPDLLSDSAKIWVTWAAGALIVVGVLLSLGQEVARRWTITRRDSLVPPHASAHHTAVVSQAPTRVPLIEAIENHANRLRDMLDARSAASPGPNVGLAALLTTHRAEFDGSAPAREEHNRQSLAIYFEQFRTPGLPLLDEAVDVWSAGNPKLRSLVEKPQSAADLSRVEEVFRRIAQNLREKETDKAMEARGFIKQYVPVDPT